MHCTGYNGVWQTDIYSLETIYPLCNPLNCRLIKRIHRRSKQTGDSRATCGHGYREEGVGGKERTGSERDPDEHGHGHGIFSAQLLALISNAQRGEQEKKRRGTWNWTRRRRKGRGSASAVSGRVSRVFTFYLLEVPHFTHALQVHSIPCRAFQRVYLLLKTCLVFATSSVIFMMHTFALDSIQIVWALCHAPRPGNNLQF